MDEEKRPMTVAEAGRKGGTTTSKRYGKEFYQDIGHKGGSTVAAKYPREHFEAIGRKGGLEAKRLIRLGHLSEGKEVE